jgi:NAD(P)-dependent dehydrogenase (short-subunit alcohol dehydrogenase family)
MTTPFPTGQTRPITLISGYRGLAENLIEHFLQAKHHLSVLVRNPSALSSLQEKYPGSLFVQGETQNREDCINWIQKTINRFGRIDNLINNAAITGPCGKLEDLKFEEIEKTFQINFFAPLFLTQLVLPYFLKQKSGVIINLSGGGATAPRPHFGAYGATKCALVRFTESLAMEYPDLCFFSVAPGAMRTPMMEEISKISPDKIGKEKEEALRRMQEGGDDPKKAAELIYWLCEKHPKELNGKLISAKWDSYLTPSLKGSKIPFWTLRRVDEALLKTLKEFEGNS